MAAIRSVTLQQGVGAPADSVPRTPRPNTGMRAQCSVPYYPVEDFDDFRQAIMEATVDFLAMDSSAPFDVEWDAGEPDCGELLI